MKAVECEPLGGCRARAEAETPRILGSILNSAYQIGKLYRARYADFLADHAEARLRTRSRGKARCIESAGYLLDVSGSCRHGLNDDRRQSPADRPYTSDSCSLIGIR